MNDEIEEKIEQEIVRRALKRSYFRKKEKEQLLYTKDIVDALDEITNLPREELEQIAGETKTYDAEDGEGFFSIRHQVIFVGLSVLTLLGVPVLAVWHL